MMRAMVCEGVSGVSDRAGSDQCAGTTSVIRYRDRYQALSPLPEPVPGSVTGTGLCHGIGARG